ncbi:MAG: hypothetical protein GXO61_05005 [Epsilonproteobacteria bacterium]|nr:hypothetical protein [Campylobacterota bacterium]
MRKSLSLLELVFSILIMGLVFSSFSRVFLIDFEILKTQLKEEGVEEAYNLLATISTLPWSEENLYYLDILLAKEECNYWKENIYRIGGAINSRNCLHKLKEKGIKLEGKVRDDLDDFDGYILKINNFTLKTTVNYLFNSSLSHHQISDIKVVEVVVEHSKLKNSFGKLVYTGYNIGKTEINKMVW